MGQPPDYLVLASQTPYVLACMLYNGPTARPLSNWNVRITDGASGEIRAAQFALAGFSVASALAAAALVPASVVAYETHTVTESARAHRIFLSLEVLKRDKFWLLTFWLLTLPPLHSVKMCPLRSI